MRRGLRGLVSKKKRRFVDDENSFDLDLSYITDRIIAMGFPSSGTEAVWRNPSSEVQRFFETKHAGHYKIYNLCSERDYGLTHTFPREFVLVSLLHSLFVREPFACFNAVVARFPFDDHHPPPLEIVARFCKSIDEYLRKDSRNVVGIHCKAGKGRTGTLICAYLLHTKACHSAVEALAFFGERRTHNGKGVTIPSQRRFVYYFEHLVKTGMVKKLNSITKTYQLLQIRLLGVPTFDIGGGCDPYVLINVTSTRMRNVKIYDFRKHCSKLHHYREKHRIIDMFLESQEVYVRDNVQFQFYDWDSAGRDDKMFQLGIHTAFIFNDTLAFDKSVLDGANKDKSHKAFPKHFRCELYFREAPGLQDEESYNKKYAAYLNHQESPLGKSHQEAEQEAAAFVETRDRFKPARSSVEASRVPVQSAPLSIERITVRDYPPYGKGSELPLPSPHPQS